MAPPRKSLGFSREGTDWFCNAGLPSDINIVVDGVKFHLHKFPLTSKCGKIANLIEDTENNHEGTYTLEEFPGGPDTFLVAAKFCYGVRVELTPRNIVMVYSAAEHLEMTDKYGEDNLLHKSESFFHKNILRNWKDCIVALQSCEAIMMKADNLQIIGRCMNAVSTMVCTDPGLFGWPMMMYGHFQSPGGSILWNGINTGARIRSSESDWWFEDISYLGVALFKRLIQTMETRGIRPEKLAGAIMYYARKYLPGLGRWQVTHNAKAMSLASFSMKPAVVDQRVFLESIANLLPKKKGKSFCRFCLSLLRVAFIIGVNDKCQDSLERRIGMQLELATLDGLLIPNFADTDTLYNTDCVERMIRYFLSHEQNITTFSPSSHDIETSPSVVASKKVSKLIDSYIAEIASDVNLKPDKIQSLAEALPESSRSLSDGLYRAFDIYFKAHPWLSEEEKERLCNIIDYQKLSIDACAHASQNERLPRRVVLQVLFFEQMQLRTALAGCLNVVENASTGAMPIIPSEMAGQIVQRDGWVKVVHENQVLKMGMERMMSRVRELEEEFNKMRQEMKRVSKSHSYLISPRCLAHNFGCKLRLRSSDAQEDVVESTAPTPRASVDMARPSHNSTHRKSISSSGFHGK